MKIITVPTDDEGWRKAVYEKKCRCGHGLYMHSFVVDTYDDVSANLRVSQCIACDYGECEHYELPSM